MCCSGCGVARVQHSHPALAATGAIAIPCSACGIGCRRPADDSMPWLSGCGGRCLPSPQEVVVPIACIVDLWRGRKLSHASARECFYLSRDTSCQRHVQVLDACRNHEELVEGERKRQMIIAELVAELGNFRDHPVIDKWMAQYAPGAKRRLRYKPLLLLGESRMGKTQKALSLWGFNATLLVNCQGLQTALPCLREWDKARHRCIVFDEASPPQVLNNKFVFQSGVAPVKLAQSPCAQHQYVLDLYGIPLVLCSNIFAMDVESGLDPADAEWLQSNVMVAKLPPGQAWFDRCDDGSCSCD